MSDWIQNVPKKSQNQVYVSTNIEIYQNESLKVKICIVCEKLTYKIRDYFLRTVAICR